MTLQANGTAIKSRNVIGWSHEDSRYCQGEDIELYGLTYKDVVLAATYEVQLRDGLVTIDLNNNRIKTFSGTTCTYTDGHCLDLLYGDIYWNAGSVDLESCDQDTFVVLYEGLALIRTYPATSVTPSKKIVTLQTTTTAFSLVINDAIMLCQQHSFTTEAPKLYIVEIKQNVHYFNNKQLHTLDINMNSYHSAKFVYLERALGEQMSAMNAHVMTKICNMELQSLSSLQTLAIINPMEFAYAWKKRPGYTAIQRGEVMHIVQCVPV